MKTGEVAHRFKIDRKTVRTWVADYSEFFTAGARSALEGQLQAEFQAVDLVTLNTIRVERGRKTDWETIRAKLAAGERHEDLPPELTTIDGNNAVVVYTQLKALETRLSEVQSRLESAEAEKAELRRDLEAQKVELRREMEAEKLELHKQIRKLERENAVLQFRLGEFGSDEDEDV